jgi:hypothetical protein
MPAGCAAQLAALYTRASCFLALAALPVALAWVSDMAALEARQSELQRGALLCLLLVCLGLARAVQDVAREPNARVRALACALACVCATASVATVISCGPFLLAGATWLGTGAAQPPAAAQARVSGAVVPLRVPAAQVSRLCSKPALSALVTASPPNQTMFRALALCLLLGHVAAFAEAFAQHKASGPSIQMARGFGQALYLDCALLALPQLHRVFGLLARRFSLPSPGKGFDLHRWLAMGLVAGAAGHGLAHGANIAVSPPDTWSRSAWMSGCVLLTVLLGILGVSLCRPRRAAPFLRAHMYGGLAATVLLFVHAPKALLWCAPITVLIAAERMLGCVAGLLVRAARMSGG